MSELDRQKQQSREAGLAPWQVGLALCGAAGAWMVAELVWRLLQ